MPFESIIWFGIFGLVIAYVVAEGRFMQFGITQSDRKLAAKLRAARCCPLEHLTRLAGDGDQFNYGARVSAYSK
jgi:hypothetical protein